MPNPQKQRLTTYLNHKKLSLSEFAELCGLDKSVLSRISETTTPSTMRKIGGKSDLNLDWLKTGEGEMLKTEIENSANVDTAYGEDEIPERFVSYLVPMAAMGGSLVGFEEEGVMRENCERVISPIANIDLVVPVCGESMEPEYPNGSKVYVRRINPDDFIAWGNVYVLDTTNGIILKVVVESERMDCVRCISLNPSGRYAPFDVPKRSIRAMYRVMLCVSVK